MSLSIRRTFRKLRFPVLLVAFAFVASSAFELRAQGSMDDEGFLPEAMRSETLFLEPWSLLMMPG